MTMLVLEVPPGRERGRVVELSFPAHPLVRELLSDRKDEAIAIGTAPSAGVWLVSGLGRITDCRLGDTDFRIEVTMTTVLPWPQLVMTGARDTGLQRYVIDVLPRHALHQWRIDDDGAQERPGVRLAAAEAGANFVGFDATTTADPVCSAYQRIAGAYGYTCALSGLQLFSPETGEVEGEAVTIDGSPLTTGTPTQKAIFLTSTLAFCFRHHLVALGEDYHILRHPNLPAEIRLILEYTNRVGMLRLPSNPLDRLDPEALRRHRLQSGL